MKLIDMAFKDALAKSTVADVCSVITSGFPSLLQMTKVWDTALRNAKNPPTLIRSNNLRVSSSMRRIRPTQDLPAVVLQSLKPIEENFAKINLYLLSKFPDHYDERKGTVRQKIALAYLSLMYHIYVYLPDYIIHQLLVLRAVEKNENLTLPPRKQQELDDGLYSFAIGLDLLGTEVNAFNKAFNEYPEVVASDRVDAILSANGLINPLARVSDGFRGSPFFTLGSWVNVKIVNYIKKLEDQRRVAQLYLDDLKNMTNHQTNPAQLKEIELLEEEIANLNYELINIGWRA